jgi:hypothetical protein
MMHFCPLCTEAFFAPRMSRVAVLLCGRDECTTRSAALPMHERELRYCIAGVMQHIDAGQLGPAIAQLGSMLQTRLTLSELGTELDSFSTEPVKPSQPPKP